MALRSRLAISVAVGALVAAACATPAVADDEWGSGTGSGTSQGDWGGGQGEGGGNGQGDGGGNGQGDGGGNGQGDWGGGQGEGGGGNGQGEGGGGNGQGGWGGGQGGGGHDDHRFTRGRVTAGTLLLRSAPNRGSQVIRTVHRGDIVKIFCKTPGQRVDGNPLWYLLADGTWAWGSARYIQNIGAAPRWC